MDRDNNVEIDLVGKSLELGEVEEREKKQEQL